MARRILLADDSVTAQNMGRRILHDAGYEVTTVNNGSAALKRIAEQRPDLIILDVYMPGYGGLEVCSRLKENKDTARIPVLLTVGKLEPFKPEEARRVRADAYIVKPFEASELLTALTKLEDKIVPGPEPYKQGRFAKAMAAVEHGDPENDFGDKESGWKDRLIIPGGKKKKEVEPAPEPVPAKGFRSVAREEDFRPAEPKREFERPMPAGLPQDIKPEEIAAIAAAAAKINGKTAEPEVPPVAEAKSWPVADTAAPVPEVAAEPKAETLPEEVPAATFASQPEEQEPVAAKAEFEVQPAAVDPAPEPSVEAPSEVVAAAAADSIPEEPPAIEAARTESVTETHEEKEEKRPVSDAEVLAALASLTPAGAEFQTPASQQTDAVGASFTGPRWAAEAVAVAEEESSTLLEHEMEKAYAAFAAADAALASSMEAVMPANGNGPAPETKDIVAEESASTHETAAAHEPTQAAVTEAVATEAVAPAVEEAAYAAAASASSGTPESVSDNQPVASAAPNVPEPEEGSRVREAELAAAWANWRHIRESIVGEQPATPVEGAELSLQSTSPEEPQPEPPAAEPVVEASAQPQAEEGSHEEAATAAHAELIKASEPEADQDPAEISSIVDNMLAELKPKLMEELKRKLKK